MNIKCIALLSITVSGIGLAGCGGSGGDTGAGGSTPVANTGIFIDSPVSGINYETETITDTTNASGEFSYLDGESVTFLIGDIRFPMVAAGSVITPLDIIGTQDINDLSVVNMARLLQSMDENDIAEDGISIADVAHQYATGMNLDFASPTFDTDVINLVANSGSDTTVLIDGADALLHLQETLQSLEPFGAPADLLVDVTLTATLVSYDDTIVRDGASMFCSDGNSRLVGDVETYQERWEIDVENNFTATSYNNVDSWVDTGTYDPETQTLSVVGTQDEEFPSQNITYFSHGSWNTDASFVSQTGSELTFSGTGSENQTTSWDYPNNDGQPNGVDEVSCIYEFTLEATAVPYPAEL